MKTTCGQLIWLVAVTLIGCSSCSDTPTNGDGGEQGPPLLRYPQEVGTYVYYQDIGGYGRINGIYRINLADSVPRAELIVDRAMFPAVSPSGKRLAYVKGGLYFMDLETRESTYIGPGDILLPEWHGEDSLVYEVFTGKIYIVDVNVKQPLLLIEDLGSLLDISESGTLVLVNGNTMFTFDPRDSQSVDLFEYPEPEEFVAFGDWSPNEDQVVFEYWRGSDRQVRVVDVEQLALESKHIASDAKYPAFSSDGSRVLYVYIDPQQRKELNGQIWIMNADDGAQKSPLTTWEMMRD